MSDLVRVSTALAARDEVDPDRSRPALLEREHGLPFEVLSSDEFEVFVFLLLLEERGEGQVSYYGPVRDGGRDLLWIQDGRVVLGQCKQSRTQLRPSQLGAEFAKVATNQFLDRIPEAPDRMEVFVSTKCGRGALDLIRNRGIWQRDAELYLTKHLGRDPEGGLLRFAIEEWWPDPIEVNGFELTQRALEHPQLVAEFFRIRNVITGDIAELRDEFREMAKALDELARVQGDAGRALSPRAPSRPEVVDLPQVLARGDVLGRLTEPGHKLLVGNPGSGKTLVFEVLARDDDAYFVVDDDVVRLRAAIEWHRPPRLLVDDAHRTPDLIPLLRRLREETGVPFDILCSTWPGLEREVERNLDRPADARVVLEPIPDEDIAEILARVAGDLGVRFHRTFLHYLVGQVGGHPGVAFRLAMMAGRGEAKEVIQGAGLERHLVQQIRELVDDPSLMDLFGVAALGGEGGIDLGVAAELLGMRRTGLRDRLEPVLRLSPFSVPARGVLRVRPGVLRLVLARRSFFDPSSLLDWRTYQGACRDRGALAETLLDLAHVGVEVPELREAMAGVESVRAWRSLLFLGEEHARWAVSQRPDLYESLQDSLLEVLPAEVLPRLIRAGIGDDRPLHSATDHPHRVIRDWIRESEPGSPEVVERRRLAIEAAVGCLESSLAGLPAAAVRIAVEGLHPGFDLNFQEPGSRRRFRIVRGLLTPAELEDVAELWSVVLEVLRRVAVAPWGHVLDALHEWVYLSLVASGDVSEDATAIADRFAAGALQDVADAAREDPAVQAAVRRKAEAAGYEVATYDDAMYEVLYPTFPEDLEGTEEAAQTAAAVALAQELREAGAEEAVPALVQRVRVADADGGARQDLVGFVASEIAGAVERPAEWIGLLVDLGCKGDLLSPFLRRELDLRPDEAVSRLTQLLARADAGPAALEVALAVDDPPEALLACVAAHPALPSAAQRAAIRGRVSVRMRRMLLEQARSEVAARDAMWLWRHRDQEDAGFEELRRSWEKAVLGAGPGEVGLKAVFAAMPALASAWLDARSSFGEFVKGTRIEPGAAGAIAVLDKEGRRRLLARLGAGLKDPVLAAAIVSDDRELFDWLLDTELPVPIKLGPLRGAADDSWSWKVELAAGRGVPADDLIAATVEVIGGIFPESFWTDHAEAFERMQDDPSDVVRAVATRGSELARAELAKIQGEERERNTQRWS